MIKTLKEIKKATDDALFACIKEAKGHTGADFKQVFGADFEFDAIPTELQQRGYEYGWYNVNKILSEKGKKTVQVKMSKDNARMNLNMTKECKEMFEKFLQDKSYNFVHTSAALMSYMDDVKSGKISVTIEVV